VLKETADFSQVRDSKKSLKRRGEAGLRQVAEGGGPSPKLEKKDGEFSYFRGQNVRRLVFVRRLSGGAQKIRM